VRTPPRSVSAIPLPAKVAPVKDSVLASENVTPVPKPPPKEATQPPPKPTDILVKEKTPEKAKVAPVPAVTPPKHPQPTPPTTKAASGDAATQLPEAITQTKNGTAIATVQDRTFGNRYAYYVQIVSRTVAQNWYTGEADPRDSQGKRASIVFDINRDGTPTNIRIQTRSGSPSLDSSALHAIQRIDSFGPLPAGDHITVEYTFDYKAP
jgi:protein TonB